MLLRFSLNEVGGSSAPPSSTAPRTAVQPRCISFQNFALCAFANRLQSPTACLGCRFVCTTSGIAQKTDAKPVGGRGISAFSNVFLFSASFFDRTPWQRQPTPPIPTEHLKERLQALSHTSSTTRWPKMNTAIKQAISVP